jgi:ABC-type branched-subunit amino acid transport system ATPase component/ABC-type branched-subunit amino acid transport system permease subunit
VSGILALFGNAPAVFVLGVVTGLQYALLAVGIVLVYKASRFVNFAHGQLGLIAAALLAKMAAENSIPYWPALLLALLAAAALGAVVERLVVQRLFEASRLVLLVASVGVAQILFVATLVGPLKVNAGVIVREGYPVPFDFRWKVGAIVLNSSQVVTLIFAPAIALGLYLFFTRTALGKAIRAAASNADAARLAGISVRKISLFVWISAGVLSGLTAILLAPSQPTIDVGSLGPSLMLRGLAAALIGRMVDLPTAFGAGIAIGVIEQSAFWNVPRGGTIDFTLLLVILVAIALRARGLAATSRRGDDVLVVERSRPSLSERLRNMHLARHLDRYAWTGFAALGAVLPLLPGLASQEKGFFLALIATFALVGLSLTVLTGWGGQASLGHFAFLGVGAYMAAHADVWRWSIPAVMLFAGIVTAAVAVIVGLPAMRFRGLFLAATTLAFALAARSWLFTQEWFTGHPTGNAQVSNTHMLGIGRVESPRAVYYMAYIVLILAVLGLGALRRSGAGRALVAVRDNERAAAAHGINPSLTKISALWISGFLAGLAGALWAMAQRTWTPDAFDASFSLVMLSAAIVGGLGTLAGPILGALAVFAWPFFVPNANTFQVRAFSSGALLLFILLFLPGGIASLVEHARRGILRRLERGPPQPAPALEESAPAAIPAAKVVREESDIGVTIGSDGAAPLIVRDLKVRFGGIRALDGPGVEVRPREIVGLIGGNGAGKTTLMNCISGHLRPDGGDVEIFGERVTRNPVEIRAILGVARSFQDGHLYPGLTVLETVMAALEPAQPSGVVGSLLGAPWVRFAEEQKRALAMRALERVGLADRADTLTGELSSGMRRLCDLACVMATRPRLVLLDEPTTGIAQREVEAFAPLLRALRDDLGCAVLIVEHDVPLLMSLCDRIYALEIGRLIAEGSPAEIRSNPDVIASYLGTDAAAVERSGSRTKTKRQVTKRARPRAQGQNARRTRKGRKGA